MNFNVDFGHGEVVPTGYTVLKTMDLPIYDGVYYFWVDVQVRVFWFFVINRKLACKLV